MTQTAARTLQVGRVGELVPRVDAPPKVKGEFAYASDLIVPGMLWGHTLRSPHAHARIRRDRHLARRSRCRASTRCSRTTTSRARRRYGLEFADQPVLAIDRVLYYGEPVALVAAEHPEQARRAAERIRVDYEPLEPVADMERATELADLHPDRPTRGHGYLDDDRPNVVRHMVIRHGDPEAPGDVSRERRTTRSGIQDQAFLGPESGLAVPDGEGGVDIYVATQWLHVDRSQVAPCLGLPLEQVRIHLAGVGGAFGGREDLSMQVHGALLALHTNRPVKIVYNREESFTGHVHRHPARIWCEHRATREGKLVNVRMRILLDGGAYASSSTAVTSNAASFAIGPYESPNALIDSTSVYTNNPPCGAMRGFGAVQTCFAGEAQMDKLAAALDIDPVELRLLNALEPGDVLPTGQTITGSLPVAEAIRAAAALEPPAPEPLPRDVLRLPGGAGNTTNGEGVRRGVGFAVGFKNIAYSEGFDDYCAARVRLLAGRLGRGALRGGRGRPGRHRRDPPGRAHRARARRRAARAGPDGDGRLGRLGVGVADDVDGRRRGSRRLPRGARGAGARGRARRSTSSAIYRHPPTTPLDPETGQITGERAHVAFAACAMKVVAEVDVDLGLTRVVWIGAAQDVGKAVNPQQVEGQIEGGTAQGLGLALMEEIQTRDGLITNASFTDYLIPTTLDMPPVESVLIEDPEPDAPYGVKGVGEPPTVVSTAAIVAALRAATGRELTRVPVSPTTSASSRLAHALPPDACRGRWLLPHDERDRRPRRSRRRPSESATSAARRGRARRARSRRPGSRTRTSRPARAARSRAARRRRCSRRSSRTMTR